MRLLIAIAFLALAAAAPEPVELPSPVSALVADKTEESKADAAVSPVKVAEAALPSPVAADAAPIEVAPISVKAVEAVAPIIPELKEPLPTAEAEAVKTTQDELIAQIPAVESILLPEPTKPQVIDEVMAEDIRTIHAMFPDVSLIDISPMIVPPEVMRQVALMAEHDDEAINVGGVNPFAFYSEEPLGVEAVKVADNPVNELSAQMDPLVVVDAPVDQLPFRGLGEVPVGYQANPYANWRGHPLARGPVIPVPLGQDPQMVSVVDLENLAPVAYQDIPMEYLRGPGPQRENVAPIAYEDVPMKYWRGPGPQKENVAPIAYEDVPMKYWRGPGPQRDNVAPIAYEDIPMKNWRGPGPLRANLAPNAYEEVPMEYWRGPAPESRPSAPYYREIKVPQFFVQNNMPPRYADPMWR